MNVNKDKIAVIGLGYVGLPLAIEFGKQYQTIGYDINTTRVNELKKNIDVTLECSYDEISSSNNLTFTSEKEDIASANIYIVTVPTPVDKNNRPDLEPLIKASKMLGTLISKGDIVIYESTVYPGATEDDCVPEIEKVSGFKYNVDFYAGYSPERINPGDKINKLPTIKKITSGSTPDIAVKVDNLYGSIITAGTFMAKSIRVAEAAKVIENTQRDVNIALMNEFSMMFNKMGINVYDVLDAAKTKWNFIPLQPGLVGGHCIGVDPYYLLQKANEYNYAPDMMRTAREINNGMPGFVCGIIIENMILNKIVVPDSNLLILGSAFKENCPDIRNTKVVELYKSLIKYNINISIYDPVVSNKDFYKEYNVEVYNEFPEGTYDVIALIVPHDVFLEDLSIYNNLKTDGFVFDMKAKLSNKLNNTSVKTISL
ncbi:nucleotide sugar dehydrogenase [Pectobacterium brasiliense]|uniref:nucleotide sugar dehydrogenase n=1 Tax=Pectobacterium brasiliense TaxID=180957 RepID=UPI00057CE420|nr:nucleotide sugar dehydrogenase [Pectobacterium brasiliense]KHS85366.1 Vi polysaccharide biosynthesis protein VipA/TviB [Pectobacterium brasiliense]